MSAPKPDPPAPKRKLRWFQFSLRSLMIFVTLCAPLLAWFHYKLEAARGQKEVVETIKNFGGEVGYGYQYGDDNTFDPKAKSSVPEWILSLAGIDMFSTVERVSFPGERAMFSLPMVKDVDLKHLKRLPHLKELHLNGVPISDEGLRHLANSKRLTNLQLGSESVLFCKRHSFGTKVNGSGFVHLSQLPNLTTLNLDRSFLTDAEMVHLAGLANLEELCISNTKVSGPGLIHLEKLPNLKVLNLTASKITDAGLKPLSGLSQLRTVSLYNTSITDAGLVHLKAMSHLEELYIQSTLTTEDGVKTLRHALPNCKIHWHGDKK